jgi:predicted nucleic acid-binding protein
MDSATPVVVDADVISFIFKDHQLSSAYQAILAGRSLTVSLVTLAEIAASALQLNIPLVTHNARDYEAIEGLTVPTATAVA